MGPSTAATERDPALLVGVLGGAVTSLAVVVGYVVPGLATSPYVDGVSLTFAVLGYFFGRSLGHHAAVLVLVPFLTAVVALLAGRRWGVGGADADLRILGGIVTGPVVTAAATAVLAVGAVAVTAPVFVVYALAIGAPITVVIVAIVVTVESAGALGGYVVVRTLESLRPAARPAG